MPQLRHPLDKQSRDILQNEFAAYIKQIGFDLLWNDYFRYNAFFESLDDFEITVNGTNADVAYDGNYGGIVLTTGVTPTAGDDASIFKQRPTDGRFDFTSQSRFRVTIAPLHAAAQTIIITVDSDGDDCYGFQIDNATLKGITTLAGSKSTVTLETITDGEFYVLDARYFPEVGKVEYRVNGELKGVLTATLPRDKTTLLFDVDIETTNTNQKTLVLYEVEILQKRFR